MEKLYRVSELAKLMSVSRVTVVKWIRSGRISAYSINGYYYIPESEVEKLIRGVSTTVKKVAIYVRVSGNMQKDDLERQIASLEDYVRKQFPQSEYIVVKDVASGLEEDRKGLKKLIDLAIIE